MIKTIIIIAASIGYLCNTTIAQNKNGKNCFSNKAFNSEKAFTKTLYQPHYKEGRDAFIEFLMANINFQKIASSHTHTERTTSDSARIKFIIHKDGSMSHLTIGTSNNSIYEEEIRRVIKLSACHWTPGGTERLLNVWHQLDITYCIERTYKGASCKVTVNEDLQTQDLGTK